MVPMKGRRCSGQGLWRDVNPVYIDFHSTLSRSAVLTKTRIFQSGNSLAVRIPKELAFAEVAQEVEIERVGDALVVRPVRTENLGDLGRVFAMFTPDFMAGGRERAPEVERAWPVRPPVKRKTKVVKAR